MLVPLVLSVAVLGFQVPKELDFNAPPPPDAFKPDPAWKSLAKNLWFDPKSRRLVMRARVALTDGSLEHLLCLKGTKEHESTLVVETAPKMIHAGLLLTGAEAGSSVKFEPKFVPPQGTAIKIELEWEARGKVQTADAREWILDPRARKALEKDWVFAGSEVFDDPMTKQRLYAADEGDLITVANFPSAILDLPIRSSQSDADRSFVANTARMPPRGTPVTLYLSPRKPAKPAG